MIMVFGFITLVSLNQVLQDVIFQVDNKMAHQLVLLQK